MAKPTIKQLTALVAVDGVTITGKDSTTAHNAVVQWANDPSKRRASYDDQRVAIVAALIAMARTGKGSITIDVLSVVEPVTTAKWNDGAALARYLRNDGIAGCADIEPLRIRQSRLHKGSTQFVVTVN